jgi:hypothetical protein
MVGELSPPRILSTHPTHALSYIHTRYAAMDAFWGREIESRSMAPLLYYLISIESDETKNSKTSCLLTEVKAKVGTKTIYDESYINYKAFLELINKDPVPPSPKPKTVRVFQSGGCTITRLMRSRLL